MAYTEQYCDPVSGSNLNSGSTTAAPTYSGVGDSDGTSVFTPSDGSTPASTVAAGDVVSVYVTAGATVATFVGRVVTVAAGVNGAITVSTTAKAGTFPSASSGAHTITLKRGGPWLGPNGASGFPFTLATLNLLVNTNSDPIRVNLLNTATYSITANVTGSASQVTYQGYTATPGDGGKAIIDGGTSGASYELLRPNGYIRDLILQNNGATGSATALTLFTTECIAERVTVHDVQGIGIAISGTSMAIECEAYACNKSNTANLAGIQVSPSGFARRCISHHNTGNVAHGFNLFISTSLGVSVEDCIADSNGQNGFNLTNGAITGALVNISACIATNNAGSGIYLGTTSGTKVGAVVENAILGNNGTNINCAQTDVGQYRFTNCAFFGLGGAITGANASNVVGSIALSSNPFNDSANGDFSLNNVAGAGAACRNAGRGSYTQTTSYYPKTTTSYPDVGGVQHRETAVTIARSTGALLGTDETTGVSLAAATPVTSSEVDILGDNTSSGVLNLYAVFTGTGLASFTVAVNARRLTGQGYVNYGTDGPNPVIIQVNLAVAGVAVKVFLGRFESPRYATVTVTNGPVALTNLAILYELVKTS